MYGEITDLVCNNFKIGNRINCSCIKTDKFKKARLSVTFTLPIEKDSTYLNSMLFPVAFLGTQKYPDFRSLCIDSEELYASDLTDVNQKLGNLQIVGVHASMLNDEFISESDKSNGFSIIKGVFEIISQIILHPLLRDKDIETERSNQIKRVRARRNDAFGYAKYRFSQVLFDGDPIGAPLIGEENQLTSFSADDLRKAYTDLIENAPMDIFYCGSLDPDAVAELVKRELSEFVTEAFEEEKRQIPSFERRATKVKRIEESGEYRQGNLLVGFRAGTVLSDKDFYASELMNQIYGDGSTSKLFLNLREEKSLCYFCASSYDEVRGIIVVGCGINNCDFEDALDEILLQLENIRLGNM